MVSFWWLVFLFSFRALISIIIFYQTALAIGLEGGGGACSEA